MSYMKRLDMELEELHGPRPEFVDLPPCHYCGKPAEGRCETVDGQLLHAFCYPFCPERSPYRLALWDRLARWFGNGRRDDTTGQRATDWMQRYGDSEVEALMAGKR